MANNNKLRMLSLCAGIGAIDYVWEYILGQEVAGQVEIDPFCNQVLDARFHLVPRYLDIKECAKDEQWLAGLGTIDLVAGGVPCQSFSNAGKRKGTEDDRHLWPYAATIIQVVRPAWVIIENVFSFIEMALDLVQTDLESHDYEVQAFVLPACALGAPHVRERAFIVAHTASRGSQIIQNSAGVSDKSDPSSTHLANSGGNRRRQWPNQQEFQPERSGSANTEHDGTQGFVANSGGSGWEEQYAIPVASKEGYTSWRTPAPGSAGISEPRLVRMFDGAANRMDGHRWPAPPGEPQHEWEPARTVFHRDRERAKRIKALGNTIVPQQIFPFLEYIVNFELNCEV